MLFKFFKQESRFLINHKQLLLSINNSKFSTTYPYKFGGIGSPKNFKGTEQFLVSTFGKQIFDNFRQAYRVTLQALVQKDKEILKSILQPNLTKNLQFKDVLLVGDQQLKSIDIITGKTAIILGGEFQRSKHKNLKVFSSSQQHGIQMMFNGNMSAIGFNGLSLLFSFNIFFNGHMKLIRADDKNQKNQIVDDLPQMHSLQFQVQTKRNTSELMKFMGTFQKMAESGNQNLSIFSDIIGKNYEWRIADIDNILNRNLDIS